MDPLILAGLITGLLLLLILVGMPIAFAMAIAGCVGIVFIGGKETVLYTLGTYPVSRSATFAWPAGSMAWGGTTVYVIDQFEGDVISQFDGETDVADVTFSADGRMLISADGTTIRVWDVVSYQQAATLEMPAPVLAVALSPDGRILASATDDGMILLWGINP